MLLFERFQPLSTGTVHNLGGRPVRDGAELMAAVVIERLVEAWDDLSLRDPGYPRVGPLDRRFRAWRWPSQATSASAGSGPSGITHSITSTARPS